MSHTFGVWAPNANRAVDVIVDGATHQMSRGEQGWWCATVDGAAAGSRYTFSIDGGPPRPDPRSPSQPDGVFGASEVVDHASFAWTDGDWKGIDIRDTVVYELHIGTFTDGGTFDEALAALPHLVDLGVNAVEFLPVAEFPGERGWGYDGVDLYAPHHAYGGPDALKRFVDAAHAAGIAVVIDVVYNHLGPAGNFLAEFAPYFTNRYDTPWGDAVNVDGPGSDEVRQFIVDNALMWLRDYHADGLRLDAVHAIIDTSATHLLEELAAKVDELEAALDRRMLLVAESDLNDPRIVTPRGSGGYGIDAQWNDDFHHALHVLLTGERDAYYESYGSMNQLATAYRRGYVFAGEYEAHRGRRHGRAPAGVPAWRFLAYLQNHDQIGNRAQGDRSSHLLDADQLRLAAALVLTSPFVPMLFQGEEWGATSPFQYFTDHEDDALGQAVSAGRRNEFAAFGWRPEDIPDPQDRATFDRSRLRWPERDSEPHASLLAWHRELVALRRRHPAFGPGAFEDVEVEVDEAARWIVVRRRGGITVANLNPTTQRVPLTTGSESLRVLASSPAPPHVFTDAVELARWGVALLG